MGSPLSRTTSREEQVAAVESHFDCFVRTDFEAPPIVPECKVLVFYDPRRLAGGTEDRP